MVDNSSDKLNSSLESGDLHGTAQNLFFQISHPGVIVTFLK